MYIHWSLKVMYQQRGIVANDTSIRVAIEFGPEFNITSR
jgi:hypothetical protein